MPTAKEQLDALLQSMTDPVLEDTQHVTGLIYGDNGAGKTVLAIELAQRIRKMYGGEILFIDAVNAWRSLKNHTDLQEGVKRVPYEGKSQLELITQALTHRPAGFENYRVVILDELSSMTDRDGDIVLATRAAADSGKDPDVLTQPDMGATTERMRRAIIGLLRVPEISIICVAHQRDDEDKNVGYRVTRPRFMPKFSGTLREGLDFVVHMTAKPVGRGDQTTYERKIQAHPTTTVVAKSRVGGLPVFTSPENFVNGVEKWLGGSVGDSKVVSVQDDTIANVGTSDYSDFVVE